MARRSLSTQGRILAAGVSVAVGSALVGFMAAGDHTADASQTTTPATSSANDAHPGGGTSATPYGGVASSDDGSQGGFGSASTGDSSFPTQPQTRTGGS